MLFGVKNTSLRNALAGLAELHECFLQIVNLCIIVNSLCGWIGMYFPCWTPPILALVRWYCICGKKPRTFWKCDEDKNCLDPDVSARKRMFLLALSSISRIFLICPWAHLQCISPSEIFCVTAWPSWVQVGLTAGSNRYLHQLDLDRA